VRFCRNASTLYRRTHGEAGKEENADHPAGGRLQNTALSGDVRDVSSVEFAMNIVLAYRETAKRSRIQHVAARLGGRIVVHLLDIGNGNINFTDETGFIAI
jgi:hypothetical protein